MISDNKISRSYEQKLYRKERWKTIVTFVNCCNEEVAEMDSFQPWRSWIQEKLLIRVLPFLLLQKKKSSSDWTIITETILYHEIHEYTNKKYTILTTLHGYVEAHKSIK